MKHRVITDPVLGLTLGVGFSEDLARIAWDNGTCHVDAADLSLGRWTPAVFEDRTELEKTPPAAVVCRATALAVGAWIKEGVQRTLEGLP